MKKNLLLLFLFPCILFYAPGCGGKDDPRDEYVGTYYTSGVVICSSFFGDTQTPVSGTVEVTKGSGDNELVFTDSYLPDFTATLNGASFSVSNLPTGVGTGNAGIMTVGGSFSTNTINYTQAVSYNAGNICTADVTGTR